MTVSTAATLLRNEFVAVLNLFVSSNHFLASFFLRSLFRSAAAPQTSPFLAHTLGRAHVCALNGGRFCGQTDLACKNGSHLFKTYLRSDEASAISA